MEYLSFKDLLDLCQVEAIATKLAPDELSIYRFYCRQYSKLFNTPLHIVETLDPIQVMKHVFEDRMDSEDELAEIENYLDAVYKIEDPEYENQRQQEEEDFMLQAQEEEAERVRLGKPIHPALKGESTLIPEPTPKATLPKSGGINMAALKHLESEEQ